MSVCCCLFLYQLSPETFGYILKYIHHINTSIYKYGKTITHPVLCIEMPLVLVHIKQSDEYHVIL